MKLLQLFKKYELLFNGTLGDWKTKLVSFQLKESASLYHGQAFPVPKIHKDTLIKEVDRLVKLGVLEWQPALEWATSEVQNKMIFMGHQILSCHVPVVGSFFIYFMIISSS
jgi:hypothetical protein